MNDQNLMDLSIVDTVPVSPESLQRQVNAIQLAMEKVMKDGVHFGKIPGCGDKPALLKAGAEKIGMMFRLIPTFDVQLTEFPGGHREYRINCSIKDPSGRVLGQGVGSCSTLESKYKYRKGEGESTGSPVPKEYWQSRDLSVLGGREFEAKKIDGQWMICKKGAKVENPDIADVYNTVLKMAKKRAHVDAIITCTAASDIFIQDFEEMVEEGITPSHIEDVPPPMHPKVTTADKLPPPRKHLYDLADVPEEKLQAAQALLTKAGAEWDEATLYWESPRRVIKLDAYEVRDETEQPSA